MLLNSWLIVGKLGQGMRCRNSTSNALYICVCDPRERVCMSEWVCLCVSFRLYVLSHRLPPTFAQHRHLHRPVPPECRQLCSQVQAWHSSHWQVCAKILCTGLRDFLVHLSFSSFLSLSFQLFQEWIDSCCSWRLISIKVQILTPAKITSIKVQILTPSNGTIESSVISGRVFGEEFYSLKKLSQTWWRFPT
jgi:hypothetical protein